MEKAVSLDPRNPDFLNDLEVVYDGLRLYREEDRVVNAAMAVPGQAEFSQMGKAQIQLEAGQLEACRKLLAKVPEGFDPNGGTTFTRFNLALYERRFPEAAQVLAAARAEEIVDYDGTLVPRVWLEALVARAAGDRARAQTAMEAARAALEGAGARATRGPVDVVAARTDRRGAGTQGGRLAGRTAGGRVAACQPGRGQRPADGKRLALIYAWTGETEPALKLLGPLSTLPGGRPTANSISTLLGTRCAAIRVSSTWWRRWSRSERKAEGGRRKVEENRVDTAARR